MNTELDEILFSKNSKGRSPSCVQRDDLKTLIENIPYPGVDITLTSYSDFSENKQFRKSQQEVKPNNLGRYFTQLSLQQSNLKSHMKQQSVPSSSYFFQEDTNKNSELKQQYKPQSPPASSKNEMLFHGSASQGSYMESLTPQRINHIVDWSRLHVTPGDSKNIFPSVIAPSIEMSNDVSVSLNVNQLQQQFLKKGPQPESPQFSGAKIKEFNLEQEIQILKRTVQRLEKEKIELQMKLKDKEEHVIILQEKYRDGVSIEILRGKLLEQAKSQLKSQISASQVKDSQINELESQVEKLKQNGKIMQTTFQQQFRELQDKYNVSSTLMPALKSQYNETQLKIKKIQEDHERQLNEAASRIAQMKQLVESLYQQIRVRDAQIQQYESEMEKKQKEYQDAQQNIRDLRETNLRDHNLIKDYKKREEVFLFQQKLEESQPLDQGAFHDLQQECIQQKRTILQLKEQLTEYQTSQVPNKVLQDQKCVNCQQCLQELKNMIEECNLQTECSELINNSEIELHQLTREVTTLLLTKQREQIDLAIEQYQEQNTEMNERINYFKNQNDEILEENTKIQNQIQSIIKHKEDHEQQLWEHMEHLRSENDQLRKMVSSNPDCEFQNEPLEDKKIIDERENLLQKQINEAKIYTQQQKQEIDRLKQELDELKNKLQITQKEYKDRESSNKKHRNSREQFNKTIQQLVEEKQKLIQRLDDVQQHQESVQKFEDKNDKLISQIKDKDKKNIELFNQIKILQQQIKQSEDQVKFYKEEIDKSTKQMNFKNSQIKTLMDQIKQLSDQNSEIQARTQYLTEQISHYEEQQKNPKENGQMVIQLQEQVASYQAEFLGLKKILQDRLEKLAQEDRQNTELRNAIYKLERSNTDLKNENNNLKNELVKCKCSELRVGTSMEIGRTTADSFNYYVQKNQRTLPDEDIETLLKGKTNIFKDHLKEIQIQPQTPSVSELLQPEMLSIEDTVQLIKEVLRRAVRSLEVMKAIIGVPEIKDLLQVIVNIENRMNSEISEKSDQITHQKRNRLLNSIILNSNVKSIMSSDKSRKRHISVNNTNKLSQRSNQTYQTNEFTE